MIKNTAEIITDDIFIKYIIANTEPVEIENMTGYILWHNETKDQYTAIDSSENRIQKSNSLNECIEILKHFKIENKQIEQLEKEYA